MRLGRDGHAKVVEACPEDRDIRHLSAPLEAVNTGARALERLADCVYL